MTNRLVVCCCCHLAHDDDSKIPLAFVFRKFRCFYDFHYHYASILFVFTLRCLGMTTTLTWSRAREATAAAVSYARDQSQGLRLWLLSKMVSKSTDRLTKFLVDNALPLCIGATVVSVAVLVKKYDVLYRYLHKVMYR